MSRIVGKLGSLYLDDLNGGLGAKVADIFNWSLDFNIDWDECGLKGSIVEDYSAGVFTGVLRAERFATDATADGILIKKLLVLLGTTLGTGQVGKVMGGAKVFWELNNIDGSTGGSQIDGAGVIRSARMTNPRGMAGENIEIMLTSVPTVDTAVI
jgi:hypothetical protein